MLLLIFLKFFLSRNYFRRSKIGQITHMSGNQGAIKSKLSI